MCKDTEGAHLFGNNQTKTPSTQRKKTQYKVKARESAVHAECSILDGSLLPVLEGVEQAGLLCGRKATVSSRKGRKKPQGVVLCRYLCLGVMQRQSSNAVEPMLVLSSHRDYYCSQLRLFPANLEYWCPLKQSMGWWVRRWWVMVPALTRETWHALSVGEAAGGTLLWGSPSLPPQVHAPRCQFLALCLQGKVL